MTTPPTVRELLARILDGWDAGRDNDDILTLDTVHEIRVALARTSMDAPPEPDAGTLAAALQEVCDAAHATDTVYVLGGDRDKWERFGTALTEARALLASRPAPRPPESDRTAALVEALEAIATTINTGIGKGMLAATAWRDALIDAGNQLDDALNDHADILAAAPAGAPVADGTAERCADCGHLSRFHESGWCHCEGDGLDGLCDCPAAPADAEAS